MAKYNVLIVKSDQEVLESLTTQLKESTATQVLVTGLAAGNVYREHKADLESALGSGWMLFGAPYGSTQEKMRESLRSFAEAIRVDSSSRHLYVGLTNEDDVVECLFFATSSQTYSCAIYVLGLYEDPLTHLNAISQALNAPTRVSGEITSIYSTSDRFVTGQFKERLAIAKDRREDIRNLSLLYFKFVELMRSRRESADKDFIRNVERTLKKEIIPNLFPDELFPETKVKPWWKFW